LQDSTIATRVMPLVTWMVAILSISGYLVADAIAGNQGPFLTAFALFVTSFNGFILSIILFFGVFFAAFILAKTPVVNVVLASLFAFICGGWMFGVIFSMANEVNAMIVPTALFLTTIIFIVMTATQYIFNINASNWGSMLIIGLVVALILTIFQFWIETPWINVVINLGVIVLFMGILIWDMYTIREKMDDDEWVRGALMFFVDFINILIRIIAIYLDLK